MFNSSTSNVEAPLSILKQNIFSGSVDLYSAVFTLVQCMFRADCWLNNVKVLKCVYGDGASSNVSVILFQAQKLDVYFYNEMETSNSLWPVKY